MTPQQWDRLKIVFQEAIDQPPDVRRAWLLEECKDDQTLLREVESLLGTLDTAGNFLESPVQVDPTDLDTIVAGRQIGAYRILGEIGRGGMGVVYLAVDVRLGRQVALKSLPAAVAMQPELRERLRREARAAATISHPAIATIYALEEFDDHLFMASEYVKGETLRSLIERGPIEPTRARAIAADIASALAAAHEAGVIHRDLKPENVLITSAGAVKVVDFGIAQIEGLQDARLTQTGSAIGTPAYMAPEQLTGGVVDSRADVYAWGIVASEMLDGRHPLQGRNPFEATPPAGRPSTRVSRSDLASLISRSLQTQVELRPTSRELLAELSTPSEAVSGSATPREQAAPRSSARWWWEFHQWITAGIYALMAVTGWYARGRIGGPLGTTFFLILLATVIFAIVLRMHLVFTSKHFEDELAEAHAVARHWLRLSDWAFVLVLFAGGILIGDERSPLTFALPAVAVGAAVAFLFIEPVTARAAFRSASKPSSSKKRRTRSKRVPSGSTPRADGP